MLPNLFTPSQIASSPDDFFGRQEELEMLERSLRKGSAEIEGPIGIGKSSLLARCLLTLEGFGSANRSKAIIAVGDRDVQTVDQAAQLVLESLAEVDERHNRITFKMGPLSFESNEVCKQFQQGRHLAALKRIIESESLTMLLNDLDLLILAVDEADKCPGPLARLVRSVITHAQQKGITNLRFLLAGVSPFFKRMIDEDEGVNRFFYSRIALRPMAYDEAIDLLETKFSRIAKDVEESGDSINIDPHTLKRVGFLSGGHPHILQLLGSHLIESENEDPDGLIDSRDLAASLQRVCYEDRGWIYDSTLHNLEVNGKLEAFRTLLELVPPGFPSRLDMKRAVEEVGPGALEWLKDHNIISTPAPGYYGLIDEFLRIRLLFDEANGPVEELTLGNAIAQVSVEAGMTELDDIDFLIDNFWANRQH